MVREASDPEHFLRLLNGEDQIADHELSGIDGGGGENVRVYRKIRC